MKISNNSGKKHYDIVGHVVQGHNFHDYYTPEPETSEEPKEVRAPTAPKTPRPTSGIGSNMARHQQKQKHLDRGESPLDRGPQPAPPLTEDPVYANCFNLMRFNEGHREPGGYKKVEELKEGTKRLPRCNNANNPFRTNLTDQTIPLCQYCQDVEWLWNHGDRSGVTCVSVDARSRPTEEPELEDLLPSTPAKSPSSTLRTAAAAAALVSLRPTAQYLDKVQAAEDEEWVDGVPSTHHKSFRTAVLTEISTHHKKHTLDPLLLHLIIGLQAFNTESMKKIPAHSKSSVKLFRAIKKFSDREGAQTFLLKLMEHVCCLKDTEATKEMDNLYRNIFKSEACAALEVEPDTTDVKQIQLVFTTFLHYAYDYTTP